MQLGWIVSDGHIVSDSLVNNTRVGTNGASVHGLCCFFGGHSTS